MDADWIDRDVKPVQKKDHVGKVYGWVRDETGTRPVVLDQKRPYAIVDPDRFMGRHVHHATKVDQVAWPVPVQGDDADTQKVVDAIANTLAPFLPVQDENGRLVGAVDAVTLLRGVPEGSPDVRACHEPLEALRPDQNLDEAMKAFQGTRAGHLPVADRRGRLQGVVAQSRLCFIQDQADHKVGRGDRVGRHVNLLEEPVEGQMEEAWNEVPLDGSWDDLLEAFEHHPYAIVTHRRKVRGVVTPAFAVRGLKAWQEKERAKEPVLMHYRKNA